MSLNVIGLIAKNQESSRVPDNTSSLNKHITTYQEVICSQQRDYELELQGYDPKAAFLESAILYDQNH